MPGIVTEHCKHKHPEKALSNVNPAPSAYQRPPIPRRILLKPHQLDLPTLWIGLRVSVEIDIQPSNPNQPWNFVQKESLAHSTYVRAFARITDPGAFKLSFALTGFNSTHLRMISHNTLAGALVFTLAAMACEMDTLYPAWRIAELMKVSDVKKHDQRPLRTRDGDLQDNTHRRCV